MVVTWGDGRHAENVAAHRTPRLNLESLGEGFYLIWGGYSEPETRLQEGFVRLRRAERSAGGRAWGEGKSHGEAWKQCQSEKGSNCELKEILNCVQEQGGRIRSGSDRVIV